MTTSAATKWGLIGTGMITTQFATGLQALNTAQLLAVSSRQLSKATDFAKTFNIPRAYGGHEEMLRDPDIDAIYIGTPHPSHKQLALDCIDAGKAILVEKPFTINAHEARQIIERAREKGVFCMEAMWMRFIPLMQEVKKLMAEQKIGPIRLMNASLGFQSPYDPQNRFFNLDLGGGALLDLGVYPLNLAFWLFGKPDKIKSHAHIGATGVDEQAGILLGYEAGPITLLTMSNRAFCTNDVLLQGEMGRLHIHPPIYCPSHMSLSYYPAPATHSVIRRHASQIDLLRKIYHRMRKLSERFRGSAIHIPYSGNGYSHEAAEVGRCLQAGKLESDTMPLDETLEIMATMDQIREQWHLRYPQES
jgi:predicted dehydrogenase